MMHLFLMDKLKSVVSKKCKSSRKSAPSGRGLQQHSYYHHPAFDELIHANVTVINLFA